MGDSRLWRGNGKRHCQKIAKLASALIVYEYFDLAILEGNAGKIRISKARTVFHAKHEKNFHFNIAVHISDSSGKIEAKQVELPVSGRLEYLKMLRKDIFHFGMGIDVDSDKFGTAPSGVSLKFQYTLLDQKAGNMTSKLKKAIKELLWYVTEDYNSKNNTNYDANLIKVDINKNMITNDAELVSMIQASKGIVSDKTLLAVHPFVSDVNAEMQEMEAEEKRAIEQFDPYKGLGDDDEQ